ncbi:hypothetical protein BDY19DRAFT_997241 [Irpex rosettiformis]|uniref:Uncharacterized protein n=1 Tax=Irpex rosettiformis TaxID=378272 RepID=A0ACB8TSU6_9APHY|nr:hypothetical protein BDY19DRAFT_997241 [Irpex rosettiformis]
MADQIASLEATNAKFSALLQEEINEWKALVKRVKVLESKLTKMKTTHNADRLHTGSSRSTPLPYPDATAEMGGNLEEGAAQKECMLNRLVNDILDELDAHVKGKHMGSAHSVELADLANCALPNQGHVKASCIIPRHAIDSIPSKKLNYEDSVGPYSLVTQYSQPSPEAILDSILDLDHLQTSFDHTHTPYDNEDAHSDHFQTIIDLCTPYDDNNENQEDLEEFAQNIYGVALAQFEQTY